MPMPPTARRRRIAPLLCLAALAAAGGCRSSNRPDYAPAANAPADYDEAMALRDYPRTPGYYANGDTRAGPTEFPFEYAAPLPGEPNYARRRYVAVAADPLIFVANLALLPATLFAHPPTEQRTYQGSIVEPSYTAAVPLPPTPEQLAAMATPPQTGPLRPVTPQEPKVLPATRPADEATTFPVAGEPVVPPPAESAEEFGTRGRTAATLPSGE